MSESSPVFYRYFRPVQFDIKQHMAVALSTGGVSFKVLTYLESNVNGKQSYYVTASVALCSDEVVFNKTVARNILDGRGDNSMELSFYTRGLTGEALAHGFVLSADTDNVAYSNPYIGSGIGRYADGIEAIMKTHTRANMLAQLSADVVEALDIKSLYTSGK